MTLAVIDILDRDGSARRSVPVMSWPVTIGRAIDNDIVVDDPHVAPHHATVSEAEGQLTLTVGQSINGVTWTNTRLKSGESGRLPSNEIIHAGAVRLRVRLAGDALPPERALFPESPASRVPLPVLLLALLASVIVSFWLDAEPGSPASLYVMSFVSVAVLLLIWCGLWALSSKLFRQRFEFWPHTRIAVSYLLLMELVSVVLPLLAFMLGVALFSRVTGLVSAAVACAMVVAHLYRVLPTRRRAIRVTIGSIFAAAVGLNIFMTYKSNDRVFGELYVPTLAPPSLRLVSGVSSAAFIEEAKRLKAVVDSHVKDEDSSEMSFRN